MTALLGWAIVYTLGRFTRRLRGNAGDPKVDELINVCGVRVTEYRVKRDDSAKLRIRGDANRGNLIAARLNLRAAEPLLQEHER